MLVATKVASRGTNPPPPPPLPANPEWTRGTWILHMATATSGNSWSQSIRDDIRDNILPLDGITGFSFRIPWSLYKSNPEIVDQAKALADFRNKKFTIRLMAGRWMGTSFLNSLDPEYKFTDTFQGSTITVPLPWNSNTGEPGNPAFEDEYAAVVTDLAAWSRANGIQELHCSQYGWAWAEVFCGYKFTGGGGGFTDPYPGYTFATWLEAHRRIAEIAIDIAGSDLMMEFPLSGHLGNTAQVLAPSNTSLGNELVTMMRNEVASRATLNNNVWSPLIAVQGNGMGVTNAAPTGQPCWHAKQMYNGTVHTNGSEYDWDVIYNALIANNELYLEVYRESFSRPANSATLKSRAAAFI